MKRKEEKEPNKYNSQNKIIEEQKIDEEDEDPNLNTTVTGSMKHYKKMETANLSTLPALISLKNKPQKEKIEEEKGEDKKLWVPDDHSQNCYNCGSKFFSLLNRRHHCRVCGNIFCKSCLESFCEITIYGEKKELKVCTYCQEKKGELNNILKNNLVEYRNDKGNKIFETKSWDYIKNKKKNQNEIDKFCGFNNIENTALSKFHDDINKNYEKLLEKMIIKVLNENSDKTKYPNLASDWAKVIFNLTKTVINNVSPSFNDLNDSININDYIKIKVIKYLDQSKCEVIDGYAMQKNVCSKKMRIDINNPKILLLKGSLEGIRIGRGNNITDALIVKSVAVEDYIEIIRKKIEKIQPQIIMVEGNASQKYQDFFSTDKMNISLITKCNIKKLNKIARCVNSFVVPSPDLIGKQKPSDKETIKKGGEILYWKNGFLTDAIIKGRVAILDCIEQAPTTVTERLNGLLDKKYDGKKKYFEVPENPNYKQGVLMDDRFRLLCTCNIEKINSMSPAFVNRFDVIVLEDQLDGLNDQELKNLITILFEQSVEKKINGGNNNFENNDTIKTEFDDYFSNINNNEQRLAQGNNLENNNGASEHLLDEFGNEINEQASQKDEFGNIISDQASQKDEFGNVINEQASQKDEFGNIISDQASQKDEFGNIINDPTPQKDEFGNIINDPTPQKDE